jgi:hypothetical protein
VPGSKTLSVGPSIALTRRTRGLLKVFIQKGLYHSRDLLGLSVARYWSVVVSFDDN